MTVSELIEHLKQFHPDLPVYRRNSEWDSIDPIEANDVYRERIYAGRISSTPGISHEAVII